VLRQGGKILVDQLAAQGVARLFMVPGESFLPILDALYDHNSVQGVVCRHEGGAAMAAEASAKLDNRPSVVLVTRGPGTANAVSGVYVAHHDETPLLLLVGLPPLRLLAQKPFQDIDLEKLFSGLAKSTQIVRKVEDIPTAIARAFQTAMSGRPGPVVVGLPQDVLEAHADIADAPLAVVAEPAPSPEVLDMFEGAFEHATRPLMIVGGPGWTASAKQNAEAFALRFDVAVAAAFRCQDYFDNDHSQFVGHLGFGRDPVLDQAVRDADLLIVAGAPLGEVVTAGHSVIASPSPRQNIVHVHPSAETIGALHQTRLGVVSSLPNFFSSLRTIEPPQAKPWRGWRRDVRNAYLSRRLPIANSDQANGVAFDRVVSHVFKVLPRDAIITNGAGNYAQYLHRFGVFRNYRSNLAPNSGSMGYGLPAALAAKLAFPERSVVCFAGDGCLMMALTDLATAVQYDCPIVILVANNRLYGTIRLHQELAYPGRQSGTQLVNPDFAALAQSFGAFGERVETTAAFPDAFARALNSGGPALLDLILDPDDIAPGRKLSRLGAS
jgi:acetolactate synthase I/II/III large subunit